jgi:hypothetical protein
MEFAYDELGIDGGSLFIAIYGAMGSGTGGEGLVG